MLKKFGTVGRYIQLAVKYYAVIIVVARAYDMVMDEIKKVHNDEKDSEDAK